MIPKSESSRAGTSGEYQVWQARVKWRTFPS
jgi:hypothetical protein